MYPRLRESFLYIEILLYTGLDLRVFDDAITFKIALMVRDYMKYMESLDY